MALTSIIRASAYRRTRWKNGGGETMEIAISPAGAGLDRFDWRISMATVASDGPFSVFAGVDRTLCILDGVGVQLRIAGEPRHLDDASEPLSFSGDAAVQSTLVSGAVTDFNVMTRRDGFRHHVQRVRLSAGEVRELHRDISALFCQSGAVSVEASDGHDRLDLRDAMIRNESDRGAWRISADVAATVLLVTISALSSSQS